VAGDDPIAGENDAEEPDEDGADGEDEAEAEDGHEHAVGRGKSCSAGPIVRHVALLVLRRLHAHAAR
jgi:hypothetical protein